MRRILLLCLVLMFVVAMCTTVAMAGKGHGPGHGGPGHGGPGHGNGGGDQDPDPGNDMGSSQTVSVSAEVLPYGEIRDWTGSLYLGELNGHKGATLHNKTSDFQIVRNTPLTLTLEITRPLTVKDSDTGEFGQYSIETKAELWRTNPDSGYWEMKTWALRGPGVSQDQWSNRMELGSFDDYAAENESYKYWHLLVRATLGDVDDQPAGTYEGEIVLTISAPSGS